MPLLPMPLLSFRILLRLVSRSSALRWSTCCSRCSSALSVSKPAVPPPFPLSVLLLCIRLCRLGVGVFPFMLWMKLHFSKMPLLGSSQSANVSTRFRLLSALVLVSLSVSPCNTVKADTYTDQLQLIAEQLQHIVTWTSSTADDAQRVYSESAAINTKVGTISSRQYTMLSTLENIKGDTEAIETATETTIPRYLLGISNVISRLSGGKSELDGNAWWATNSAFTIWSKNWTQIDPRNGPFPAKGPMTFPQAFSALGMALYPWDKNGGTAGAPSWSTAEKQFGVLSPSGTIYGRFTAGPGYSWFDWLSDWSRQSHWENMSALTNISSSEQYQLSQAESSVNSESSSGYQAAQDYAESSQSSFETTLEAAEIEDPESLDNPMTPLSALADDATDKSDFITSMSAQTPETEIVLMEETSVRVGDSVTVLPDIKFRLDETAISTYLNTPIIGVMQWIWAVLVLAVQFWAYWKFYHWIADWQVQ